MIAVLAFFLWYGGNSSNGGGTSTSTTLHHGPTTTLHHGPTTTLHHGPTTTLHHKKHHPGTTTTIHHKKHHPGSTTTSPSNGSTTTPPTTSRPTTTSPSNGPTTTRPTTTLPPVNNGSWWVPSTGVVTWQWEIGDALNLNDATEMGTNDTLPNGSAAPDPKVFDIDGIDNPASTVSALHAKGDHVICYMEVGTAGNYGGAYTTYYNEFAAAGDLGSSLSGYPEKFLNINSASTVSIVESIINQQCNAKGFDAVETDLDETFNNNEGSSGFTITQADEESYLTTLANYMHRLGLGWIAKNVDDTGSQSFVNNMMNIADGAITEQCNQYSTCSLYKPFEGKKAIFNAEYSGSTASFCPADIAADINGALFNVNLNGPRSPCQ